MIDRPRLSVDRFPAWTGPVPHAVRVNPSAPDVSRPQAGTAGAAAGPRLRAIDTLLADRGQLFRALFLAAPIPKALVDLDGHVLVVNDALCTMTGRTPEDMVGRHVDLLAHPDEAPVPDRGDGPLDPWLRVDGERRLRRADGTELWTTQSHEVVHTNTGAPQFVVLSLVDVTDRRRAEEDLVRRAFTDPLTGLPNRRHLERYVAALVERGEHAVVGVCDLDGFKAVNTEHGHLSGDMVLQRVAANVFERLRVTLV